jgi:hypothetical protein
MAYALWLCDSFLPSKMSPQMSSNDDLQHWSRLSVIRALAYPFPGFASCYRYVEYRMFLRFFEYCRIHFRADHQQMSSQHAYRDKLWQAMTSFSQNSLEIWVRQNHGVCRASHGPKSALGGCNTPCSAPCGEQLNLVQDGRGRSLDVMRSTQRTNYYQLYFDILRDTRNLVLQLYESYII